VPQHFVCSGLRMNILSYTAAFPNFNRLHGIHAKNVLKYYAGNPKLPNLTYEEENYLLALKKTQWHLLLSLNYVEIKNISRNFRRKV
jgi:hypothetical protein